MYSTKCNFLGNVTFAPSLSIVLDTYTLPLTKMQQALFFCWNAVTHFSSLLFQGRQLKLVEDEVYHHLVKQIKLHTESVLSDVEKATTALSSDPKDLHDFSNYALMVHTHTLCGIVNKYMRDRFTSLLSSGEGICKNVGWHTEACELYPLPPGNAVQELQGDD